jgi:hypothetical protein
MTETDQDGYTRDSPTSLRLMVLDWEDCTNTWNPPDQREKTGILELYYLFRKPGSPAGNEYQAAHPGYDPSKDPLFNPGGGTDFLSNLVHVAYQDRVTGANLDELSTGNNGIRETIRQELGKIGDLVETDRIPDYSVALTTIGEYWGQLASRVPGIPQAYNPDPNGDVLRLKYITHGNRVTFGAALNFGAQLLEGLIDPVDAVGSDEADFEVTFDATATVDLQLPRNYTQNLQVLSAVVHLSGAAVYPANATALYVVDPVSGAIENGVNGFKMDVTQGVQGSLQDFGKLISDNLAAFDQAEYSIDTSEAGNPTLKCEFIQHPSREYDVHIDHLDGQFSRGPVENYVTVQIGTGEPAIEVIEAPPDNYETVVRTYAPTNPPPPQHWDGSQTVVITLNVLRRIVQRPFNGQFEDEGGIWYVVFDDGTPSVRLPPDFDGNDPMARQAVVQELHPPITGLKRGLLETNEIFVNYATRYVYGRYPDNLIYIIQAALVDAQPPMTAYAAQVTIPGTKDVPQVQFTITMSGTRNGAVCNDMPEDKDIPRRRTDLHRTAVPAKPTDRPIH